MTGQNRPIALGQFGDRTSQDIADLMSLPEPVVAELLRSALRKLSSAGVRVD